MKFDSQFIVWFISHLFYQMRARNSRTASFLRFLHFLCTFIAKIFKMWKNIIRIITGCRSRDSCTDLFKNLKILHLQSQYILSLLLFVVNSKNKFKLNSEVYQIVDKNATFTSLHRIYHCIKKGVFSFGIKLFDSLPQGIKFLSDNPKQFKSTLKNYWYFCSVEEYLM